LSLKCIQIYKSRKILELDGDAGHLSLPIAYIVCQHRVPQPAKELAPLEEPVCNMTGRSPAAQTTPQEASEPNYRSLQRRNLRLEKEYAKLWDEWKELGEVLSELQAKHQPLGQLEDSDIIPRAEQLRYSISNLSQQWPGDTPMKSTPAEVQYLPYLQSITPESSGYLTLLNNPNRRPQIIEAFIWRVLTSEVFGRFHWAGEEIAPSVRDLERWLATSEFTICQGTP
jgi:hypothetical protein